MKHTLSISTIIGAIFLAAFTSGSNSSMNQPITTDRPEPAATVEMKNTLKFTPDTVVIHAGETVLWKNTSLLVHTVTDDPSEETIDKSASLPDGAEPFDSGNLDPEESFEHTFTVPGTYNYFCIPHEAAMRGVVIVKK